MVVIVPKCYIMCSTTTLWCHWHTVTPGFWKYPNPSLPLFGWAEINPAEWTQHFRRLTWHVPGVEVGVMEECPSAEFMTPRWNIKTGDLFPAGPPSSSSMLESSAKSQDWIIQHLEGTFKTRCRNRQFMPLLSCWLWHMFKDCCHGSGFDWSCQRHIMWPLGKTFRGRVSIETLSKPKKWAETAWRRPCSSVTHLQSGGAHYKLWPSM